MEIRYWIGYVTVALALISYIFYFRGMLSKRTKPDVSSWVVWGTLTSIIFVAQLTSGAGPGSWVSGVSALACFAIAAIAYIYERRRSFSKSDKLSLAAALIAVVLWFSTKNPFLSVVLVTTIDALGFIPTYSKSIKKPKQEPISMYMLSGSKFLISLAALEVFSPTTVLYPLVTFCLNAGLVLLLFQRRRQLAYQKASR